MHFCVRFSFIEHMFADVVYTLENRYSLEIIILDYMPIPNFISSKNEFIIRMFFVITETIKWISNIEIHKT